MPSISIHALREEGDGLVNRMMKALSDFYPRPPRGGRLFKRSGALSKKQFLSTPSARRATLTGFFYDSHHKFLSTPSARRATRLICGDGLIWSISIHALREEGDVISC